MYFKKRIEDLINLGKFSNLNNEQKSMVIEAIYANCLILSERQREKYFRIIEGRLRSIECLEYDYYYDDGICYGGIVKCTTDRNPIDEDGMVFPFIYDLKYKLIDNPFGRLTRSILHEFGHVVVKKENVDLTSEETRSVDDALRIDLGGLEITEGFINDYGHMLTETMNEFTTFLSNRAYLNVSHKGNNERLRRFAEMNGLEVIEQSEYDFILYDNLYSSYPEEVMSHDDGNSMFNLAYTRYSPLTKLIMHSFQNPVFSENDLKEAYRKGGGLEAQIEDIPINDFFYGYYESSFHTEDVFNEMMGDDAWRVFNKEFDSKMYLTEVDYEFVRGSIEYFQKFYKKRIRYYLDKGLITDEQAEERLSEYNETYESCNNFYFSNLKKR